MRHLLLFLGAILLLGCGPQSPDINAAKEPVSKPSSDQGVSLLILGTVQDGGRPHIDCQAACCLAENLPDTPQHVVSLALTDSQKGEYLLFEATPDISHQLRLVNKLLPGYRSLPSAVFLTHAHIGHYTGLMYFGKEAKGAKGLPVYSMPLMKAFLQENGPWGQLVADINIRLIPIVADSVLVFQNKITVTPFLVPHRDEYSETVGYFLEGPNKTALFIPDINKWEIWDRDIAALIKQVDLAFLDGSFYDDKELPGRNMADIPHPFIVESMALFDTLSPEQRDKIHFIHMNHTNSLLDSTSIEFKNVINKGYHIARQGQRFEL